MNWPIGSTRLLAEWIIMRHLASPESVEREKWRRLMNWFKLYCKMKLKIGKSCQFIVHRRSRSVKCQKGERRKSVHSLLVNGTLWKTFERAGIETIKKILKNILQNPHEEKFRRLKISGKVFRFVLRGAIFNFGWIGFKEIFSEKLLPTEGAIPLLYDLGFQESGTFEFLNLIDVE